MTIIHVPLIQVNRYYIAVPHDCMRFCVECHVNSTADLLTEHDLFSLLSDRCKAPDRSVVLAAFDWASVTSGQRESTNSTDLDLFEKEQPEYSTRQYNLY